MLRPACGKWNTFKITPWTLTKKEAIIRNASYMYERCLRTSWSYNPPLESKKTKTKKNFPSLGIFSQIIKIHNSHPKGQILPERRWEEIPTQWDQVAIVLQHYISVQISLSRLEPFPLLPGEVYGHISECHWPLKWHTHICTTSIYVPQGPDQGVKWVHCGGWTVYISSAMTVFSILSYY